MLIMIFKALSTIVGLNNEDVTGRPGSPLSPFRPGSPLPPLIPSKPFGPCYRFVDGWQQEKERKQTNATGAKKR